MKSLQGRLAVWLIASLGLLFVLYWLTMSRVPRYLTEEYVASRLEHDGESLLVGLRFSADGRPQLDPGYVAPVYNRPYSGHYYVVDSGAQRLRSRSLWDEDLSYQQPGPTLQHAAGPQNQPLLLWTARFEKHGREVRLAVAEDMSATDSNIAKFRLRFTAIALAALVLLIALQRLIVRNALRPLGQIGNDCRRLERGVIDCLSGDVPTEVRPLVNEVNRLILMLRQRLQRQRNALGNLAHALKSPLTVLTQLLDRDTFHEDPRARAEMRRAVERIREITDRELRRARLSGEPGPGQRVDVARELPAVIDAISKVHRDRAIDYQLEVPEHKIVAADREDLLELFGNLLDNAGKWAMSRVRIVVSDQPGLHLRIDDDGPGVDDGGFDQLAARGTRLDESMPGHGLGLSIVKEIVAQHGGTLEFARSEDLGGLRVCVTIPFGEP